MVRGKHADLHFSVVFKPCGAERHPSFSSAVLNNAGMFELAFPYLSNTNYMRERKTQYGWAQDRIKHLRS